MALRGSCPADDYYWDTVHNDPNALVQIGPALLVALVVLAVLGTAAAGLGRTGYGRAVATALLRACAQLALLGLLITAVMAHLGISALFVAAMAGAASFTAAGRATGRRPDLREVGTTALAVALPAVTLVSGLVAGGVVPARGIAVIPVAGIVMGGAMTCAGLSGQRAREEIAARWGEVEAGLALGLQPHFIRLLVCRQGAASALIPPLDQTRTVGLVTIPGSFVGMVLGGASPLTAAAMQLLVLASILCCGPIAVIAITRFAALGWYGEFRPAR